MHRFRTKLAPGKKRPYKSWTLLIVPANVALSWGPGQKAVRGSLSGFEFRGTASRGEGAMRVPISREFREKTQLACGDIAEAVLELDTTPPQVVVPTELRAALNRDREVSALFEKLAPSMRRAWANYVAEAKQPEARKRRASRAAEGIRARAYPR